MYSWNWRNILMFALEFLIGMHYFSFRRKLNKEMVDFEIWIWLTKKNHDSSYARVKIFGNYLMKSPNKPKNFFFHEIHGWPAFAYLDWPKWLQNCPFDEWWSHQVLESLIKKKLNNSSRIILPYCNSKVGNFISFEFLLRKKKKKICSFIHETWWKLKSCVIFSNQTPQYPISRE